MTTIRGSYDMGMAMIKAAMWTIEQSLVTNVGLAATGWKLKVNQSMLVCQLVVVRCGLNHLA